MSPSSSVSCCCGDSARAASSSAAASPAVGGAAGRAAAAVQRFLQQRDMALQGAARLAAQRRRRAAARAAAAAAAVDARRRGLAAVHLRLEGALDHLGVAPRHLPRSRRATYARRLRSERSRKSTIPAGSGRRADASAASNASIVSRPHCPAAHVAAGRARSPPPPAPPPAAPAAPALARRAAVVGRAGSRLPRARGRASARRAPARRSAARALLLLAPLLRRCRKLLRALADRRPVHRRRRLRPSREIDRHLARRRERVQPLPRRARPLERGEVRVDLRRERLDASGARRLVRLVQRLVRLQPEPGRRTPCARPASATPRSCPASPAAPPPPPPPAARAPPSLRSRCCDRVRWLAYVLSSAGAGDGQRGRRRVGCAFSGAAAVASQLPVGLRRGRS